MYTIVRRCQMLLVTALLASSPAFAQDLIPVRLVTNWFAQPEHGGFYAALQDGLFEDVGLDVTITQGGPQVATMALLASGQTDLVMSGAADVLFARDEGIPIVAFFGTFQNIPQGLMFHEGQAIESFEDLAGRTVAVTPGAAYWEFISNRFGLEGNVQVANYSGQIADWLLDETRVTQIYVTSEPFVAMREGASPQYLAIGDSGFNPYSDLIATTERFIAENPEVLQAFTEASIEGWRRFLADPLAYFPTIVAENDSMTEEFVAWATEQLTPFVVTEETEATSLGIMTLERWQTLTEQLVELELIDSSLEASETFTDAFIIALLD